MTVYEILNKFAERKSTNSKTLDFSRAMDKKEYDSQVETWKSYYDGNVPDIHSYKRFNGVTAHDVKRRSMRLAKQIVKKWATMLFTEAFKITLKNDAETDKFNELAKETGFRAKLNNAVISGYALGTSALLASADLIKTGEKITGGKVKLDLIQYPNIYPIVYIQDEVSTAAFVRTQKNKDEQLFYICIITTGEKTVIENAIATVKGNDIQWQDFPPVEMSVAPFAWIRPNTLNDYSETLPFGQSIFADALAPIVDVDLAASGLRRDLKEGDQVTFIGRDLLMEKVLGEDEDGKPKKSRIFDNPDGQFYAIPEDSIGSPEGKKRLFEQHTPTIRTQQYNEAIKNSVDWATMNSGLGKGTLDVQPQQTATGVIFSESEKMQNKSLHEQYLETQIIRLVKAMCELSATAGRPIDASTVTITFEDSVIVDTDSAKRLAMAEVDAGLISKEEYRQRFLGETPEEARAKIAEIAGKSDLAGVDDFDTDNDA